VKVRAPLGCSDATSLGFFFEYSIFATCLPQLTTPISLSVFAVFLYPSSFINSWRVAIARLSVRPSVRPSVAPRLDSRCSHYATVRGQPQRLNYDGMDTNEDSINPLEYRGSCSATANNMKLIDTLAVDGWTVTPATARRGLGGAAGRPGPSLVYKCNSPPVNGQCSNHRIAV